MSYLLDTDKLHAYYHAQSAAICKLIGAEFAADLDKFARSLIFGLWHCHKLCDEHAEAINEIYSSGCPRPTYLYWEVVTAAASEAGISVPDFFKARAILDRSLGQSVCANITAFLKALLLRLCSTEMKQEETEYISAMSELLNSVVRSN